MSERHELNPEYWVITYSDVLLRFALTRVNDREEAMDLVQDTFLSALKSLDSYKGEISEKNWLFTIIKNKIIDYYRKKKTSAFSEIFSDEQSDDYFFDAAGHWRAETAPTAWNTEPHSAVEQKEFMTVLESCLRKLKKSVRVVFSMKYLDESDSEEICKELSISPSNYWVIIHRAKLHMRSCIEKNWIQG